MEFIGKRRFFPLLASSAFVLCVLISALIGSMIITSRVYSPDVRYLSGVSFWDGFLSVIDSVGPTTLLLFLLFFAGYSSFGRGFALSVMAYRGICFGYTASMVGKGALAFPTAAFSLFSIVKVSLSYVALALYFVSSVGVGAAACLSAYRSSLFADDEEAKSVTHARYIVYFAVISGGVFFADILKLLVLILA